MRHFNIVRRVTALELESCLPHVVHSKIKPYLWLSQTMDIIWSNRELYHSLCQGTYLRPKIVRRAWVWLRQNILRLLPLTGSCTRDNGKRIELKRFLLLWTGEFDFKETYETLGVRSAEVHRRSPWL